MLRLKGNLRIPIIISLVIATIFLAIASSATIFDINKYSKYDKSFVSIVELDRKNEIAHVYYEYQDRVYEEVVETYSDDWAVGEQLLAYINPQDGNDMIIFLDLMILPAVMILLMFATIFITFVLYIVRSIMINQKTKVRKFNYSFLAEIVDIYHPEKYHHKNVIQVIAAYEGNEYVSNLLIGNINHLKQKLENHPLFIKLYLDPKNFKRYYLDYKNILIGLD